MTCTPSLGISPAAPDSKSEIVVPVVVDEQVVLILDVDSDKLSTFDDEDRAGLERISIMLASEWPNWE